MCPSSESMRSTGSPASTDEARANRPTRPLCRSASSAAPTSDAGSMRSRKGTPSASATRGATRSPPAPCSAATVTIGRWAAASTLTRPRAAADTRRDQSGDLQLRDDEWLQGPPPPLRKPAGHWPDASGSFPGNRGRIRGALIRRKPSIVRSPDTATNHRARLCACGPGASPRLRAAARLRPPGISPRRPGTSRSD